MPAKRHNEYTPPFEMRIARWRDEVRLFRNAILLAVPRQERIKWIASHQLGGFRTFSAGYYEKARGHQVDRKNLDEGIFIYCIAGNGFYRCGGQSWRIEPGDLVYCWPRSHHGYGADPADPWTIYWMHCSGPRLHLYERMLRLTAQQPLLHLGIHPELIYLFQLLLRIFQPVPQAAQWLAMQSCAQNILSLASVLPRHPAGGGERLLAIQRVIAFMEQHLHEGLTLADLSRRFGTSPAHFCKVFHKHTGDPPQRYFHRMQMRHACLLLGSSGVTVRHVAAQLGFADAYYFSRLFKKFIGLSPQNYQRGLLETGDHANVPGLS